MYAPVLVEAADPVVSLEDAKAHLVVEHDEHNDIIEAFVAAATVHIERKCGIALGEQDWQQDFDSFGCMRLPVGPAIDITSVVFKTSAGDETTVAADQYDLRTDYLGAYVRFKDAFSTPSGLYESAPIRVTWTAGIADVPSPLIAAIKLIVGDLYANREAQSDVQLYENPTANALMSTYRIY